LIGLHRFIGDCTDIPKLANRAYLRNQFFKIDTVSLHTSDLALR